MGLTFELASFTVSPQDEPALLAERPAMIAAVQRVFPAVLGAWLTRQDDGSWLDVLLWRTREDAEDAARRIHEVPEAHRWFRHVSESNGIRHVEVAHTQLFGQLMEGEPGEPGPVQVRTAVARRSFYRERR
jgi:hypothetical protein